MDATDGLAVALCHHYQNGNNLSSGNGTGGKSWDAFIKANPERISKK